ncbi:MAG TPA: hypothetical protein VD837_14530 [Terriglobales bacterium]|nr:hypothetical protein [Terriglobales bacterium]
MRKVLTFVLLALAMLGTTQATTIVPLSVEDLTRGASTIVRARATRAWSEWNPERTVIYTYTRFNVSQNLKGLPSAAVVVKQAGGTKDGLKQRLFGVRHFQVGEEAVLFLRPSKAHDGTLVVVGLMQGNFRVLRSATGQVVVTNGVPDVSAVTSTGQVSNFTGATLTLQQLESRVRKAVTK